MFRVTSHDDRRRAGCVSLRVPAPAHQLEPTSQLTPAARPRPSSSIPRSSSLDPRPGFTLIEMLVVISIMMILTIMTVTAVNFTMDAQRISGGARQIQSYLEGARGRAFFAKQPRGVRFLLDPANPRTVSSMVFIGAQPNESQGTIQLERLDDFTNGTLLGPPDEKADGPAIYIVRGFDVNWYQLVQNGMLFDGARIKIPIDSGSWYTVSTARLSGINSISSVPLVFGDDEQPGKAGIDDDGNGTTDSFANDDPDLAELGWAGSDDQVVLQLSTPYRDPGTSKIDQVVAFAGAGGPQTYLLEQPPAILPNEEPVLLPRNIVIDLDRSQIPSLWQPGGGAAPFSSRLDLLFSPRGTVSGSEAVAGLIHFALAELVDTEAGSSTAPGIPLSPDFWQDSRAYVVDDWIVPSLRNGFAYQCVTAGTSAGSPPDPWPTSTGTDINDGSVTWRAFEKNENVIVTLFTQTGNISSHPVFQYPLGQLNDPFLYAKTGEVSGK